jgi:cell division protein FtsW
MGRRALIVLLVAVPAVALGALGVLVIGASTPSASVHLGAAVTSRVPTHFASRQIFALIVAALVAAAMIQLGPKRVLRAAPVAFILALLAALAVFVPGVGVRAAGANRWVHLGPFSINPAPLLIAATAMLIAAWGRPRPTLASREGARDDARDADGDGRDSSNGDRDVLARRPLALGLGLLAVLAFVAEPDFSSAAITVAVALVAFAGAGAQARRLLPTAGAALLLLALLASRFGYVGGRVSGFLSPESDRRGKGFEVLALARTMESATPNGTGLGHGAARHRLSSPDSDYVFAVVTEELGRRAADGVVVAWLAIGAGALLAGLRSRDARFRSVALGAGAAALAPAALHIAVCRGWVPIIGVSMPLVSYDPAATVAAGVELGLVAAVALAPTDV